MATVGTAGVAVAAALLTCVLLMRDLHGSRVRRVAAQAGPSRPSAPWSWHVHPARASTGATHGLAREAPAPPVALLARVHRPVSSCGILDPRLATSPERLMYFAREG